MISTRYLGVDVRERPVEPQPTISRQERQDEVSILETGGSPSSREQGEESLSKALAALNTDSGVSPGRGILNSRPASWEENQAGARM